MAVDLKGNIRRRRRQRHSSKMSKFKTISTQVAAQSSATLRHLRSPQMNTNVIGIQKVRAAHEVLKYNIFALPAQTSTNIIGIQKFSAAHILLYPSATLHGLPQSAFSLCCSLGYSADHRPSKSYGKDIPMSLHLLFQCKLDWVFSAYLMQFSLRC